MLLTYVAVSIPPGTEAVVLHIFTCGVELIGNKHHHFETRRVPGYRNLVHYVQVSLYNIFEIIFTMVVTENVCSKNSCVTSGKCSKLNVGASRKDHLVIMHSSEGAAWQEHGIFV